MSGDSDGRTGASPRRDINSRAADANHFLKISITSAAAGGRAPEQPSAQSLSVRLPSSRRPAAGSTVSFVLVLFFLAGKQFALAAPQLRGDANGLWR